MVLNIIRFQRSITSRYYIERLGRDLHKQTILTRRKTRAIDIIAVNEIITLVWKWIDQRRNCPSIREKGRGQGSRVEIRSRLFKTFPSRFRLAGMLFRKIYAAHCFVIGSQPGSRQVSEHSHECYLFGCSDEEKSPTSDNGIREPVHPGWLDS